MKNPHLEEAIQKEINLTQYLKSALVQLVNALSEENESRTEYYSKHAEDIISNIIKVVFPIQLRYQPNKRKIILEKTNLFFIIIKAIKNQEIKRLDSLIEKL